MTYEQAEQIIALLKILILCNEGRLSWIEEAYPELYRVAEVG